MVFALDCETALVADPPVAVPAPPAPPPKKPLPPFPPVAEAEASAMLTASLDCETVAKLPMLFV